MELEGAVIHSAICFRSFSQHNQLHSASCLLDLVFSSNFADLPVDRAEYGQVQPDNFHSSFIIYSTKPVRRYKQNGNTYFFSEISVKDYPVLYNAFSNYDWS
jgi:hypothetical protein